MLNTIFQKVEDNIPLTRQEAVELLSIPNLSPDYYRLLAAAGGLSRREYGGRGYIFAQIGLNSAPCSGNCKFCSLASSGHMVDKAVDMPLEEVLQRVSGIDFTQVAALFLMTTADYDRDRYLEVGRAVRQAIPPQADLVANVGDFDAPYAQRLKETGFTGAYHIVRLREGVDTDLPPARRVATLDAIRSAGLRLYYCVEPIGPEHSYEELADEMLRARDYHVDIMAAMRRVNVPGTACVDRGEIDDFELTKIVAVTRLVTRPARSMNVHEPLAMALLAGVNQFYAELGVNPRDSSVSTEEHRGFSVPRVAGMLRSAGYEPGL